MCIKLSSQSLKPGDIFTVYTKNGTKSALWGFNNGKTYNSRLDSLETVWKNFNKNRGILKVKNFYEGSGNFKKTDNGFFNIGVIYSDKEEFSVITVDAVEIVKPHHHRQALLIDDDSVNDFLNGSSDIKQLDQSNIKLI